MTLIYLTTTNDTNGNPRRSWIQFRDGLAIASYDEGYVGVNALPEELRKQSHLAPQINVTPTELKRWKQAALENGRSVVFADGTTYQRNGGN